VLFVSGNKLTIIKEYLPILSSGLTLLIVGAIDDKTDISAKYRLIIQLLLSFFIAFSGIRIISLYGLFGIYEINTWMQYALTILVITGVVNAFNLIDGV
jgi:UDP-GlcNAc:undecaprenyl-phosphate GlcNAc-1-phosphate transferase